MRLEPSPSQSAGRRGSAEGHRPGQRRVQREASDREDLRACLSNAADHWGICRTLIIGEKLRSESPHVKAALSRQGRYQQVTGNLQVKEVRISDAADRFVICHNPDAAIRDAAIRGQLVAKLELSAEDIALGYKQLLEVERGWRDTKQVLDLRPVYHRLEERIRAHVLLCRLALLLIRIAENRTGQTWPVMRREHDRIHLGTFTGRAGTYRQRTELSKPARDLLAKLSIDPPPKMHELTPGT